ncbi:MAG: transporter substrate-binding domain-containing protein [Fretibacterium sp.]|nr:transporter substrate-binding domain-containing protein [Fretibacterium sp.]
MIKKGHVRLFTGIAAAALILAVAAGALWVMNAGQTDVPVYDGSLQKVLDAGQLLFGFDADFPPMSFADGEGEIVGFDIDMLQEVCSRLGVEFIKRPINWNTKEDDLNRWRVDCIGGLLITPGRAERMDLSEPYIKEALIFVVPGSSSARSLDDLKGKKIGVQSGSKPQEALKALDIYKEISVATLKNNLDILQELKRGTLDAGLVDSVAAYYFVALSSERYFVLPERLGEEKFAIGFRKNDKALRDRFQEIISEMKADGTLGKISEKWFESDITIVR